MAETGEQQLVVVTDTTTKDQAPAIESMTPETARIILEEIIKTPESSFTEHSDLSKVGQYTDQDIRKAIELMTKKALGKKFGIKRGERSKYPGGEKVARLSMNKEYAILSYASYKIDPNYAYGLDRGLVEMRFPITTDFSVGQTKFEFVDHRKEIPGLPKTLEYAATSSSIGLSGTAGSKLERFRTLFKGLKWLSINVLNWDKDEFILPEDVNNALPAIHNL